MPDHPVPQGDDIILPDGTKVAHGMARERSSGRGPKNNEGTES